jgi:TetR/AcrR family transcriptional regulator, transcriptional repressor for nem operon
MTRTSDKRERLMEAAVALIHRQGFNQTTLADIAQESGVPLGNVYYYFKSKEDIADAVIDGHMQQIQNSLREVEDKEPDPKKRLSWFIKRTSGFKDEIASHGCPVGSLCQELNKEDSPLATKADAMIKIQVKWATEQFKQIGRKDAPDLAVQLVATLQGISLLANAMKNPDMLGRQVTRLHNWICEM